MDLRDFGSTLARWWYLTLATVLLAIAAGVGAFMATGPTYEADSTVVLLPPKAVMIEAQADKTNYAPNNPLLYLDQLTDARDVLVRNLASNDVQDQLKKQAPGATVTVTTDATSNSPLMIMKSTANSEDAALKGIKSIDAMVPSSLKTYQDKMSIGSTQRITSMNVTEDTKATASHKTAIEMAVVGTVGVLVLGLALIALLDQLRNRRARKAVGTTTGTRVVEADGSGATADDELRKPVRTRSPKGPRA